MGISKAVDWAKENRRLAWRGFGMVILLYLFLLVMLKVFFPVPWLLLGLLAALMMVHLVLMGRRLMRDSAQSKESMG